MHARTCFISSTVAASLSLAILTAPAFAQAKDPFVGTWVLNAAKSTYVPAPGPKAQTVRIEGTDQTRKIVVDVTPAVGSVMHWEVAGPANKELPVTGTNPNADTYVFHRMNATTIEARYWKGGKRTITQTAVVSPDGKTMTVTGKGTNVAGQTVSTVAIFDKKAGTT
jgi:hypothetical protein